MRIVGRVSLHTTTRSNRRPPATRARARLTARDLLLKRRVLGQRRDVRERGARARLRLLGVREELGRRVKLVDKAPPPQLVVDQRDPEPRVGLVDRRAWPELREDLRRHRAAAEVRVARLEPHELATAVVVHRGGWGPPRVPLRREVPRYCVEERRLRRHRAALPPEA